MKEVKLNIISLILIIFAVIVITSLVIMEIVKYCGVDNTDNVLENKVSVFEGDRHINFIEKEPIVKIDDNLRLKPVDLVIKNDSAELSMIMDVSFENFEERFPLKCKISDSNNNILYESEDVGNIYEENKGTKYHGQTSEHLFELENYAKDNSNLKFELYNKNDDLLETVTIDTTYDDLKTTYDTEFEKISETNLRNFLNNVSAINGLSEGEESTSWIDIALLLDCNFENFEYNSIETEEFLWGEDESEGYRTGYLVENVDNVIESFWGMPIENKMNDLYEIIEKDGKEYYALTDAGCGYAGVNVIDIDNIEYSDGKYNVTYTYWYQGEQTELEFNDEYGQDYIYERTIEVVKNEEGALTKFKILSIGDEKII